MESPSLTIFAICGYRRSGKDYLASQITRGEISGWEVFEGEPRSREKLQNLLHASVPVYRESFAGPLKKEVATVVGLNLQELEERKEDPLPESLRDALSSQYNLREYTPPTYRSILIEHGSNARARNPDHWVEALLATVNEHLKGGSCIVLITDLRFTNELALLQKYCKENSQSSLLTARVYRSCVPIPPSNIPSEHDLDTSLTDLLLCPSEDAEKALSLFPQYCRL